MIKTGRELVSKKDVTDTAPVKDKIKVGFVKSFNIKLLNFSWLTAVFVAYACIQKFSNLLDHSSLLIMYILIIKYFDRT